MEFRIPSFVYKKFVKPVIRCYNRKIIEMNIQMGDYMITSTSNPQVKNLVLLNKKAKERIRQGVFLTEGKKMLKEAPREWIHKIYVSESYIMNEENLKELQGFTYEILSDSVFRAVSDTVTPQGVLTVTAIPKWNYTKIIESKNGCFLLLEGIQDPGNLGTMLRTAEAAGMTAVIADKTTVDIYHPKTIRGTMGSIYRIPFFVAEDFEGLINEMKQKKIKLYAAHLEGSFLYDEMDYQGACGFLIGNEGNGLTEKTASLAEARIQIPMAGKTESLNAAVAAAVLMYEANRQRRR